MTSDDLDSTQRAAVLAADGAVIVAAGPVFNLLFAYLIFIVIFMIGVPSVTTKIGDVVDGKPAARAGMLGGDRITAVNGKPVSRWDDFAKIIAEGKLAPLQIDVQRGGAALKFTMVPESRTTKNLLGDTVTNRWSGWWPPATR